MSFIAMISGFIILKKKKSIKNRITPAQIKTLLNVDNKLTALRLAQATNTSVDYAKKVLDNMTLEGKLNVSAGDSELIYSKALIQPPLDISSKTNIH